MKEIRTILLSTIISTIFITGCGSDGTSTSDSCTDGIKNQNETDVDCGGICQRCVLDKTCRADNDCDSGNCDNGTCGNQIDDQCPDDPNKTKPGQCGCGIADEDPDSDEIASCHDNCPNNANASQTDSDSDDLGDACDGCPNDADKSEPGDCGCGVVDTDTDSDSVADCIDNCPDIANPSQENTDSDDLGDACDMCPDDPNNRCNCFPMGWDGCPTGATEWCDSQAIIDPYSSDQAKLACQTCLGDACVLYVDECSGESWTVDDIDTNPLQVAFGYMDNNCSGAPRGRIWTKENSDQGLGYWAGMPEVILMDEFSIRESGEPIPTGIAFSDNTYWTCSGGGHTGERLKRYNSSGELMYGYQPDIDFMSISTLYPGEGPLFAKESYSPDILIQTRLNPGSFDLRFILTGGTLAPSGQGDVVVDTYREMFVSLYHGAISRWNKEGVFVDSISLQGFGVDQPDEDRFFDENEIPRYSQGISLAVTWSGHYLTFFDGTLSVWNEQGQRLWMTTLDGFDPDVTSEMRQDQYFSLSYTGNQVHGQVWLAFSEEGKTIWHRWDIGL